MIILPNHQTLIITPPESASRSITDALCGKSPYGGWMLARAWAAGSITIRRSCRETLVTVRNPLDRLVSLWFHLVDECKRQGLGSMAFYVFAAHVRRQDLATVAGDPFCGWNLTKHLEGVTQELAVVRYESTRDDLSAAGLPIEEIGALGRTANRSPRPQYYHKATLAAVEVWAKPDCERFGHEWPKHAQAPTGLLPACEADGRSDNIVGAQFVTIALN